MKDLQGEGTQNRPGEIRIPYSPAAQISAILESTQDLIWSVDPQFRLISYNTAVAEHLKREYGEQVPIFGFASADRLPPERAALFERLYRRALTEGAFREEHNLPDGRCLELSLYPIVENGNVKAISVFGKDITGRRNAEIALRRAEAKYRGIFENAVEGIFRVGVDDRLVELNPAAARILGFGSPDESVAAYKIAGALWVDLKDRHRFIEQIERQQYVSGFETQLVRKDGSPVWVSLSASVIRGHNGLPQFVDGFISDIAARKEIERELRESEERHRTLLQMSTESICLLKHDDFTYVDANGRFTEITQFPLAEILGRTPYELGLFDNPSQARSAMKTLERDGIVQDVEIRYRTKHGDLAWGLTSARVVQVCGERLILVTVHDVTPLKIAERQIASLSFYDSLTGLPNRIEFRQRLESSLARSQGEMQALLFLDLDDLHIFNETRGHETGDLLLRMVGERLAKFAPGLGFAARLGGDEFAFWIENLQPVAGAAQIAALNIGQSLLEEIGRPHTIAGKEFVVKCSIGAAVFESRNASANDVMKQADLALDEAKASGRNTVKIYSPGLEQQINSRTQIQDELGQGIAAGQFVLYYQPQIFSGRLTGAEALLRWNHPVRGILPPGEFIGAAEISGLILPIGEWVMEEACRQLARWAQSDGGDGLSIAVNVSARQLNDPGFVDMVLAVLERTAADPTRLHLEITESMAVESGDAVTSKMGALKARGISFALDDFGTGYSSLSYLHKLPCDFVKIDRSFVQGLASDSGKLVIAQAIMSVGKAMGLEVIAEGVETRVQEILLARIGCLRYQGFLYGRPVPLSVFESQFLISSRPLQTAGA